MTIQESPETDRVEIEQEIDPLGDKISFVRLVDTLPKNLMFKTVNILSQMDLAAVQAARVSFGSGTKGPEADTKLLRYLMKHSHETPFEMAIFKFHIRTPIFVARQWFRHRMASYNEISGRYTKFGEQFYVPSRIRYQEAKNKQGSETREGNEDIEPTLIHLIDTTNTYCSEAYKMLLASGVAKELARVVLPVSTYTEFYWTVNSRSLMNFLRLRLGDGAQWEIKQFAQEIQKIFQSEMPVTSSAFSEFVLDKKAEV